MIAILSRIFKYTGPQVTACTMLGLSIMVLGGLVSVFSQKIISKACGRNVTAEEALPIKLLGLGIAAIGLIIIVYAKG